MILMSIPAAQRKLSTKLGVNSNKYAHQQIWEILI